MLKNIDFTPYFSSPECLANKLLNEYWKIKAPSFPIDPFDILNEFEIIYQFRDFKKLEGVYIVPEDDEDIPIIGININRPIARQRYTAIHELCHHIKDRIINGENQLACDLTNKSPEETFAENFASFVLMPTSELIKVSDKYLNNGYVSFEDALYIADYFGVSFQSCICTLAYRLHRIAGDTTWRILKKRIDKFKPNEKRKEYGIAKYDINLLESIINSYTIFFKRDSDIIWNNFKRDFVFNENRLEGVQISEEEVAEIITDLRLHKQNSQYCMSEYSNFIEVAGHASLYDYIMETEEAISAYKILNLHKLLFQYAPYPELAGITRTTDNHVSAAKFETVPYQNIVKEIVDLDNMVKDLLSNSFRYTLSEYIAKCVEIHHRITVIHPFNDGNGRVSRIFFNWLLKLRGLPPVYLKLKFKEQYYQALEIADTHLDFTELNSIFLKEVLLSMIQLNKAYCI